MATLPEAIAVANHYHKTGKLDEARQLCREMLALDPSNATAWHLLGRIAHDLRDFDESVNAIERSLQLRPENPLGHLDLGRAFQGKGKEAEAASCFRMALQLKPDYAEAHSNLGLSFERAGQVAEAIAHYRCAIDISPTFAVAHYNLGNMLQLQGSAIEAISSYRKAIELNPNMAVAHSALGAALQTLGNFGDALISYDRALAINPSLAPAHVNRAQLLLLLGDFPRGWPEYEWRWKTSQIPARPFRQPQWEGSSLAGRTILIHAEQGLGDTLQFIRYAPQIKDRGGTVILECPKPLIPLLERCRGIDRLVASSDALPHFDVYAPMLSLPRILGSSLDNLPSEVPYVFADPSLVAGWQKPIRALAGFRIGVNWQGRPGFEQSVRRDIPLTHFARLANDPRLRLICLQKGAHARQHLDACPSLVDFGDKLDQASGAFMDSAAILSHLDLVITSDTSIAHLAGAMGKAVWVALPFVPDWRWLLHRTDSPWYPTLRLFRQKAVGDWQGVFDDIHSALQQHLASWSDGSG